MQQERSTRQNYHLIFKTGKKKQNIDFALLNQKTRKYTQLILSHNLMTCNGRRNAGNFHQ